MNATRGTQIIDADLMLPLLWGETLTIKPYYYILLFYLYFFSLLFFFFSFKLVFAPTFENIIIFTVHLKYHFRLSVHKNVDYFISV